MDMAHIDGSHGENLSLLTDVPRRTLHNADFLDRLQRKERAVYTAAPHLALRPMCPFAAQNCRTIMARTLSQQNTKRNGMLHEIGPLFPYSLSTFCAPAPLPFSCMRSCSIRGQEVPACPRFRGVFLSIHPSALPFIRDLVR